MGKQAEKINTTEKKEGQRPRKRSRVRVLLWAALTVGLLVLGGRILLSDELETTFYHLYSPKTANGENIRVVVLSDLHNREFGPGNGALVERIAALRPDLIWHMP